MADKKISQLTNLTGANLADNDEFVLVDTSADETKAITWSELKEGLDTGTGFVRITGDTMTGGLTVPTVDINGGTIDGTVIGGSTPAAGSFTTGQFGTSLNVDGTVTASDSVQIDSGGTGFFVGGGATGTTAIGKLHNSSGLLTLDTDSTRSIKLATGTTQRLRIDGSTGDISFYEDTGTTPKFFWDASAESLGIGTTSPSFPISVSKTNGTYTDLETVFDGSISGGGGESSLSLSVQGDALGAYVSSNLTFSDNVASQSNVSRNSSFIKFGNTTTGSRGTISFGGTGVGSTTEVESMRIDSSGSLLVGTTTNPSNRKFRVYGPTEFDGAGVSLITHKSSGTEIGSAGQGNYVVSGGPADGYGITSATSLVFGSGGYTERMRIDASGNLLVGTTTALEKFTCNGRASFAGYIYPTTDNAYSCGLNGNRWSAIWAANGTIQTSDQRDKTEIVESPLGLDFVLALEPVAYKFKVGKNLVGEDGEVTPVAGTRQHFGLIAQQVKEVCGEVDFGGWIKTDPEDSESAEGLRYDQFVAPLIKAIQEQQAQIEDLKARVAALEA